MRPRVNEGLEPVSAGKDHVIKELGSHILGREVDGGDGKAANALVVTTGISIFSSVASSAHPSLTDVPTTLVLVTGVVDISKGTVFGEGEGAILEGKIAYASTESAPIYIDYSPGPFNAILI